MRAGTIDLRIALQRKTINYSSSGVPYESWSNIAVRWAEVKPVTGSERNAAQQWIAREQTQFTIRWSADVDDLSPVDRVIFPSSDSANSPPPSRSMYDIMSVHEVGRHESMLITAARRVG